jgi:hypothetical protein
VKVAYGIGVGLALLTALLGRVARLDRDRALYPTLVVVIASYYILFAVMGASAAVLLVESTIATAFTLIAVAGFRSSLWLVVAALAGHGIFDLVHSRFVNNPGVPLWWPGFCLAFDVALAACLAWALLRRGSGAMAHAVDD